MVELGLRSAAYISLRSSSFSRVLGSHDNPTESFFFFKGTHMSVRTIKQRLLSGSSQCTFDRPCCPPLVSRILFFLLLQCTTCRSKTVSFSTSSRQWVPVGRVFLHLCIMSICQGQDTWPMHAESPRSQQNPCFSFGVTSLGRSWQCDGRSLQAQMMHGVPFWVLIILKDLW